MSIARSKHDARSKHAAKSKATVRSTAVRSKGNRRDVRWSKFFMVAAGLLLCVLVSCGESKYKIDGVVDYVGAKGIYITDVRGEKWIVTLSEGDRVELSEGDEVTLTLDTMHNGNENDDTVLSVSEKF